MNVEILHDKKRIEGVLVRNTPLHIYELGDLDDFFWHKTIWFSGGEESAQQMVLLYCGAIPPVLIALYDSQKEMMKELLQTIKPLLPSQFYAHLGIGLVEVFGSGAIEQFHGKYCKMMLKEIKSKIPESDSNIRRLGQKDVELALMLYEESYENNVFNPRMLETGKYFGYYTDNRLVGIAGVHVYSERYRVAALGNITVHPSARNKGIGEKLTTALCSDLLKTVDTIGLNVAQDNKAALRCYEKVGFEAVGEYEEYMVRNLV
jgi:predicted GNAT family acetyltransferase